jgi:phosphoglucosamine mutase
MRKLFGTDGIRAIAGEAPLDVRTIHAVGLALAHTLTRHSAAGRRVLLGMDTRESSEWISTTIAAGLREGGVTVESAGVITTPGIAYLTRKHAFAAGVVISASHNPWQDNGIKVFGGDGYKLPDEQELEIEAEIFRHLGNGSSAPAAASKPLSVMTHYRHDYEKFLRAVVPSLHLHDKTIVVDCANGAASTIAPELFAALGGTLYLTHAHPDGRNINENCGALHPEVVAAETAQRKADIGITLDGDADRALFADANGRVVNGDAILLLAGRDLQARGLLKDNTVVATTMSNMGLEAALRCDNIRMLRAPVGDKYVLQMMREHDATLGGEQSGHILFPAHSTTGDGLMTALLVLDIVQRSGKPLHELVADLTVFPQVIVNVRVREKQPLDQLPEVRRCIHDAEMALNGKGRVVVRYSGTEALARVMIEAESREEMERHAGRIADALRSALGV